MPVQVSRRSPLTVRWNSSAHLTTRPASAFTPAELTLGNKTCSPAMTRGIRPARWNVGPNSPLKVSRSVRDFPSATPAFALGTGVPRACRTHAYTHSDCRSAGPTRARHASGTAPCPRSPAPGTACRCASLPHSGVRRSSAPYCADVCQPSVGVLRALRADGAGSRASSGLGAAAWCAICGGATLRRPA